MKSKQKTAMQQIKIITPQEALLAIRKTVDEQLQEAVNGLLSRFYSGTPVAIHEEMLRAMLGEHWNPAEHPGAIHSVLERYRSSGWSIREHSPDPHRRSWILSSL